MVRLLITMLLLAASLTTSAGTEAERKKLRVLSWSSYLEPAAIAEFEKRFDVDIQVSEYHNESMRLALLRNKMDVKFDLVIASNSTVKGLVDDGFIDRIDYSQLPNYSNMNQNLLSRFHSNTHAVILTYSPLGIIYNSDKIIEPPKTWSDFLNAPKQHPNKVKFIGHYADLFDIYNIAFNGSIESLSLDDLYKHGRHIEANLPYIGGFGSPGNYEDDPIILGTSWMVMAYGYTVPSILKQNSALKFIIPEDGTKVWPDTISVSKDSQNKLLAHQFINFLMEPEIAARMQTFTMFASSNLAAQTYAQKDSKHKKVADHPALVPRDNVFIHVPATQEGLLFEKKGYLFVKLKEKFKNVGGTVK